MVYAQEGPKSPSADTGPGPSMPRGWSMAWPPAEGAVGLDLDQTQARRGDYRLELGVHIQLLDDVADVPFHGVRGDAQALRHRPGVVALSQQAEDVELARREVGKQLLAGLPVGHDLSLARDRLRKERHRDQHLADRSPPDRFDDLFRGRHLG